MTVSVTALWIEKIEDIIRKGRGFNLSDRDLSTLMSGVEYLSAVIDQAGTLQADFKKLDIDFENLKQKYEAALEIIQTQANQMVELGEEPGLHTTWYAGWTQGWNHACEGGSMADCAPALERFKAQWNEALDFTGQCEDTDEDPFPLDEPNEYEDFADSIRQMLTELSDEGVLDGLAKDTPVILFIDMEDTPERYFDEEISEEEWANAISRVVGIMLDDEDTDEDAKTEEVDAPAKPPSRAATCCKYFDEKLIAQERECHDRHFQLETDEPLPTTEPVNPDMKKIIKEALKVTNDHGKTTVSVAEGEGGLFVSPTEWFKAQHKISMFERRIEQLERDRDNR